MPDHLGPTFSPPQLAGSSNQRRAAHVHGIADGRHRAQVHRQRGKHQRQRQAKPRIQHDHSDRYADHVVNDSALPSLYRSQNHKWTSRAKCLSGAPAITDDRKRRSKSGTGDVPAQLPRKSRQGTDNGTCAGTGSQHRQTTTHLRRASTVRQEQSRTRYLPTRAIASVVACRLGTQAARSSPPAQRDEPARHD